MISPGEDDSEDAVDSREFPDESDIDSFDEPGLEPCPYCRKMLTEDAERCQHCGQYLSLADAPRRPLPGWLVIATIAAFVAVIFWLMMQW